jgi:serpin B
MKSPSLNKALVTLLILSVFSASCEKKQDKLPTEPVPINLTLKQASVVESGNDFAFDIFKLVLAEDEGKNIMISPLSISMALSMAVNGAAGDTRDSILKTLRVNGLTVGDLNQASRDLTKALLSVDKRIAISIANSVWTEEDFPAKKAYIDLLEEFYSAQTMSFDSSDPNAHIPINNWIESATNGLIKNMLDKVPANAVMYLINAIYFKGEWKAMFDAASTSQRPFHKADGQSVNVPTMVQEQSHKVYDGTGFTMIEMPYGQGNFVMDVILPDDISLINSGTPGVSGSFNSWVEGLHERNVKLYMPKFKYGYKITLNQILGSMGMGIAFDDRADFSEISDIDLVISRVLHQSFIENNEKGTEAAAATIIEIGYTSVGPTEPHIIDLNRPFVYIIREVTTNTVLFMGTVNDPLAE